MIAEPTPDVAMPSSSHSAARELLLIWQNPKNRMFVRVGKIEWIASGGYRFQYLPIDAANSDFVPLDEYPEIGRVYDSAVLPAFFANRVMSKARQSYHEYLSWLGIDESGQLADVPMEVLATTGGSRVTDTFQVVPYPIAADGRLAVRFLISGISHCSDAPEAIKSLRPGAELQIVQDKTNPINHLALCLHDGGARRLGWIPDWMLDDVRAAMRRSHLRVIVLRVNPQAPDHLKVLCRISEDR